MILKNLIKISNDLDSAGLTKEADYLDAVVRKLAMDPDNLEVEEFDGSLLFPSEEETFTGADRIPHMSTKDLETLDLDLQEESLEEPLAQVKSALKELGDSYEEALDYQLSNDDPDDMSWTYSKDFFNEDKISKNPYASIFNGSISDTVSKIISSESTAEEVGQLFRLLMDSFEQFYKEVIPKHVTPFMAPEQVLGSIPNPATRDFYMAFANVLNKVSDFKEALYTLSSESDSIEGRLKDLSEEQGKYDEDFYLEERGYGGPQDIFEDQMKRPGKDLEEYPDDYYDDEF
ncbi:MAG: hypothetical protein CBE07_001585 [Pelagibacteraceae bacterium TMED247]|nr:MAG: hypothetical protein CBE07_001585 [Pelagibacteraceae bacterium TMED247]|tara:strand:- start:204 stop:1070 length:867 start_codon:yes stop_codon:yes gene_type:complete